MTSSKRIVAVLTGALLTGGTVAAGETKDYSGLARLVSVKSVMPLASGDGVVSAQATGIATLSTMPPSLFNVKCAGLGVAPASGDSAYKANFFCTFAEDEENGFDIAGTQDVDGGSGEVIGGSGRWKGTTGKLQFKRQSAQGDETTVTFKLSAQTPNV